MRATILLVLVAGFCVDTAFAKDVRPYIGVNLHLSDPHGEFRGSNVLNEEAGASTGLGGQVDVGLASPILSGYIGYRRSFHQADAKGTMPGSSVSVNGDWTISRMIFGFRISVLGSKNTPVKPLIGAGFSTGTMTGDATAKFSPNGQSYSEKATSSAGSGWFYELGFKTKANEGIDFIGQFQYHEFDAKFASEVWNGTMCVSFYTIQLGAAFLL
ncbi:MAG: outer membrane beta-barrel protein [Calditrichota bacterium]